MTGVELLAVLAIAGFLTCVVVALFCLSQALAGPATHARVDVGVIAAALSIPFAVATYVLIATLLAG